jgi:hypothetical protein
MIGSNHGPLDLTSTVDGEVRPVTLTYTAKLWLDAQYLVLKHDDSEVLVFETTRQLGSPNHAVAVNTS